MMQSIHQDSGLTSTTITVINQFNEALNRHDVDAVMDLMTETCVFDNTYPAPDGQRYEGQEEVRGFWNNMLRSSPDARFETEEMVAVDDRCTVRWRYNYTDADGIAHHIRGIDLFRVQDGKVAEKFAYVKG